MNAREAEEPANLRATTRAVRRRKSLAIPRWLGPADASEASAWLATQEGTAPITSNQDYSGIPFQRWYRFKEAFSPRFVAEALMSLSKRPKTCGDPFGGSGTTALTCQFLGVRPTTIEVNPFLADLIEAKLTAYDPTRLIRARRQVAEAVRRYRSRTTLFSGAPPTFVEPGHNGRWIFDAPVALRIATIARAIDSLPDKSAQRLLRVALASVVVPSSNVLISGKGRRYKSARTQHQTTADDVDREFELAFQRVLFDACRYSRRACSDFTLLRGDSREKISHIEPADLILFSPPYPNSFDYTDIYNVELWALGYLQSAKDNRRLREATLRSHVQIKRAFSCSVTSSPTLLRTVETLESISDRLWNPHLPAMVGAYFEDLAAILRGAKSRLSDDGRVMLVVGDSRYGNVKVDVAKIIREMAPSCDLRFETGKAVRSMRASAQQGGDFALSESLLVLRAR